MITNLVFRGGGVRGIAYAGALKVLEDRGVLQGIKKVAGASAGAITASLVALKYSADGIKEIVSQLDFKSLCDGWDPLRIVSKYGLYTGDRALEWLQQTISAAAGPNLTFSGMRDKGFLDLRVVAASFNTEMPVFYSAAGTPNQEVAHAIRGSMSIPIFFKATEIAQNDLVCDGGTILNYPINVFDIEDALSSTLGLYLTNFSSPTLAPLKFDQPEEMFKRLFNMIMNGQDVAIRDNPITMGRTILIDGLGISATDFSITPAQAQALYQSGIDCTEKFFQQKSL